MLTKEQYEEIRKELDDCARPLFFFHDDADGLASFLLMYRYKKDGQGVVVKSHPKVVEEFAKKVDTYNADKVFILDLAMVDQDFIDAVKVPIVWIDHHSPLDRKGIKYFNPRLSNPDDNIPVSYICYNVVQQDLWIAMMGVVGDWYLPKQAHEFILMYPDLLSEKEDTPEKALFESKLGKLIRIMEFDLKGRVSEVMKCVKIFTRINGPYEILNQETSQGKYIYKKFEKINEEYEILIKAAVKKRKKKHLFVYEYKEIKNSFTKELSNELLYRYPEKVIIVAREKSGEMKISLRSKYAILPPMVQRILTQVHGYGGGHEHACGAAVKTEDFKKFIKLLEQELIEQSKEQ